MATWALGVDLGGTNVRAAEVNHLGQLGFTHSEPVDYDPARGSFDQLTAVVRRVLRHRSDPPIGIGLGVTGPVDPATGTIANPYTLPASYQGPVVAVLQDRLALPVLLENDANVAVLAEAHFGAGQGKEAVACITVGTGIGVGVWVRGHLHSGSVNTHPEAGHAQVDPNGPECYCGARGCLEALASATAVLESGIAAGVIDSTGSARDVHLAARNNPVAEHIVANARRALAIGARNLVAMHALDTVVLAGNALGDTEKLLSIVQDHVDTYRFGPPGGVMITASQLGGNAGTIGAAGLVFTS